jgi:CRISPR-associated protein Cas2
MLYVICYDIPSNRRRRKLANVILDFGGRFQDSCYEVEIPTKSRHRLLLARIWDVLLPEEDTVRIYRLCAECAAEAQTLGINTVPEPLQQVLII